MLDDKSLLVYGLTKEELNLLTKANLKTITITKDMANMKLKEIIDATGTLVEDNSIPDEKVILFNGYSSMELKQVINFIRIFIKGGLLAAVTPVSIDWTFKYLISHLMQERYWIEQNQKGR